MPETIKQQANKNSETGTSSKPNMNSKTNMIAKILKTSSANSEFEDEDEFEQNAIATMTTKKERRRMSRQ